MPFNIGPGELIIVLIIALIVVGPGKLPDVGAAIGKSLREFRRAAADVNEATTMPPASPSGQSSPTPPPPPPAAAPTQEQSTAPSSQEAAPVPGGSSGSGGGQGEAS